MNDNKLTVSVFSVIVITLLILVILFFGEPDLHDVILNRLSDGKIPIPVSK